MDFWQTRGGIEFQYKLLHQLTRLADGIETQNSLYERLLPLDDNEQQLATNYGQSELDPTDLAYYGENCDNCENDKCRVFIAKPIWLHDDNGNDVMQHCRCTCTCHLEKEITV
jgi:hypothetical protein